MNLYFYINANGEQAGPVSPEEFAAHGITQNTLVWCTGMEKWTNASEVKELSAFFIPTPPAPPVRPERPVTPQYKPNVSNQPKPDNNLTWAILSTIFCCMPLGIPAIIFANKVDALWANGCYEEARDAANKAKTWSLCSLGGGVIVFLICFFLGFISAI